MPKLKLPSSTSMLRLKATTPNITSRASIKLIIIVVAWFGLLLPVAVSAQDTVSDETAPVSVLSFKWSKDRRATELAADDSATVAPQPAMIPANKTLERQRRINDPAGTRDPNADTLDGRSAELDRITAEARDTKPQSDGFTYQAKIQNKSAKVVTAIFWAYEFKEKNNPTMLSRRQFVCYAKVKPEKTKELEIFTLTAPTGVVSVKALEKKSDKAFDEAVVINRVEYEDGSTWQRKDWNYDDVKLTAKPASDTKKSKTCRGL